MDFQKNRSRGDVFNIQGAALAAIAIQIAAKAAPTTPESELTRNALRTFFCVCYAITPILSLLWA